MGMRETRTVCFYRIYERLKLQSLELELDV